MQNMKFLNADILKSVLSYLSKCTVLGAIALLEEAPLFQLNMTQASGRT